MFRTDLRGFNDHHEEPRGRISHGNSEETLAVKQVELKAVAQRERLAILNQEIKGIG